MPDAPTCPLSKWFGERGKIDLFLGDLMKNTERIVEYGYITVDFNDLDDEFIESDGRATLRKEPYGQNNPRPAISRHTVTGADRCPRS